MRKIFFHSRVSPFITCPWCETETPHVSQRHSSFYLRLFSSQSARYSRNLQLNFIKKPISIYVAFTVQHSDRIFYVTHTKKYKINNNRANNELNIYFCGSHGDGMWFRVSSQADRRLKLHKIAFKSFAFSRREKLFTVNVVQLSIKCQQFYSGDMNHKHTRLVKNCTETRKMN